MDHSLVVCPFPLLAGHLPKEGRGRVPGGARFERALKQRGGGREDSSAAGKGRKAPLE